MTGRPPARLPARDAEEGTSPPDAGPGAPDLTPQPIRWIDDEGDFEVMGVAPPGIGRRASPARLGAWGPGVLRDDDAPPTEPLVLAPTGRLSRAIQEAKMFWRRRSTDEPDLVLILDETAYRALGHECLTGIDASLLEAWLANAEKRGALPKTSFYGMPIWLLGCVRGFIVMLRPTWMP